MFLLSTGRQLVQHAHGGQARLQCAVRMFASSSYLKQQSSGSLPSTGQQQSQPPAQEAGANHKTSAWDKKYLVWSGKYKSVDQVPEFVHKEAMERANNRVRIRGANIMMILTVVGCILMVVSGKKAAEEGDSVQKQNLDWHKTYNEGVKENVVKK